MCIRHFHAIVEAYGDNGYMCIDEKPVFIAYNPDQLPDPQAMADCWRELAIKSGLKGIVPNRCQNEPVVAKLKWF